MYLHTNNRIILTKTYALQNSVYSFAFLLKLRRFHLTLKIGLIQINLHLNNNALITGALFKFSQNMTPQYKLK